MLFSSYPIMQLECIILWFGALFLGHISGDKRLDGGGSLSVLDLLKADSFLDVSVSLLIKVFNLDCIEPSFLKIILIY